MGDGKLNGKATVIYSDSSKEQRTYKENKLTGPAALFAASGERIEFEYQDGVVHGPAKIRGGGDTEECNYTNGVKHGKAIYTWKAGEKGDVGQRSTSLKLHIVIVLL